MSDGLPPLTGIKVIELTTVFAGPGLGLHLADQGAEVIKVEPIGGDPIRGRPYAGVDAPGFLALNRNKRSIALDIRVPDGRAILTQLIDGADIVTENFRPGVLERQGLNYEVFRERNPGLIWVSITGYGRSGPYRDRRGYDKIAQAIGGTLSYRHWPDGTPMYSGMLLGDITTGMTASYGVALALLQRMKTGKGQRVDADLLRATLGIQRTSFVHAEAAPTATKYVERLIPWQAIYRASDGRYVMVAMQFANEWADLCRALDLEYIIDDPLYAFPPNDHVEELSQLIAGVFETRTSDEWMERLIAHDVPSAHVNSPQDAIFDEHIRATGMAVKVDDPRHGPFWSAGAPITLEDNPPRTEMVAAPAVGQHSVEVLRELGYGQDQIESLVTRGVVQIGA